VKAGALKYGTHLRTPSGSDTAVVTGGWAPRQRDGWMWDLTMPGNNDHDFYIDTTTAAVLVHNDSCPLTNSQAQDMANRLGYRATKFQSSGQRVFTNGKNFITQDVDSHTGGLWKVARTVAGLASKQTQMGAYDYNLNYTGP
jgi:putative RNase toxin 21 of polymorphic toxin system